MFQDIKLSDDLNTQFINHLKSESQLPVQNQTMTNLIGLDLNIYVLQVIIHDTTFLFFARRNLQLFYVSN